METVGILLTKLIKHKPYAGFIVCAIQTSTFFNIQHYVQIDKNDKSVKILYLYDLDSICI